MTNCIDTMQQRSADELDVYYCYPHLIYSECFKGDTDIKFETSSLQLGICETVNMIPNIRELIPTIEDSYIVEYPFYIMKREQSVISSKLNTILNSFKNKFTVSQHRHSEKATVYTSEDMYNDRLKKNNVFDISECLKFTI
jgi:hypothetical protein